MVFRWLVFGGWVIAFLADGHADDFWAVDFWWVNDRFSADG